MVLKGGPGRAPLLLGGNQLWVWVPVYGQLPFPLSARTEATEANVMSTASDHAKTKARIFRILVTMRRAPSRRASWPGPRFERSLRRPLSASVWGRLSGCQVFM